MIYRYLKVPIIAFFISLSHVFVSLVAVTSNLQHEEISDGFTRQLSHALFNNDISDQLRDNLILAPFLFPQLYRCYRSEVPSRFEYMGQSNEDKWLYEVFYHELPDRDRIGGTFIEIGALDGKSHSNTWFFEKKFDWRGILIEGHPSNARELRKMAYRRPNSVIVTTAICHLGRGEAFGAVVDVASKKFLSDWHTGQDGRVESKSQHNVSCIPLDMLLKSTGLIDIDLFSLDVEGAELMVLETIDLSVINIRFVVVELDGSNPSKDQAVRDLLLKHGFENAVSLGKGDIRDRAYRNQRTQNEVWVNGKFTERKLTRMAKARRYRGLYHYATGIRCNDDAISAAHGY